MKRNTDNAKRALNDCRRAIMAALAKTPDVRRYAMAKLNGERVQMTTHVRLYEELARSLTPNHDGESDA